MTRAAFSALVLAAVLLILPGPARATFIDGDVAVLNWLDKVTARVRTIRVPVGTTHKLRTLRITVHACRRRPPEEPPESAAFLTIREVKPDRADREVFSGWMFASSPALNAMEHPVYDVWVRECVITDKERKPEPDAPGQRGGDTVKQGDG